jgi:aspartyl-tRNA(Asn)/glutamyl-tRNA(Gln) amidotransferase subunit A
VAKTDFDFRDYRVSDLAAEVRSRTRSARELTEATLARIEQVEPELNAFVVVDAEQALETAAEIDRRLVAGEGVGPLAGIPLAVKDLEDVAGLPTRLGSRLSSTEPARGDSVLVARLRAAGCVVIGKTTTPEYGHKGATECGLTGDTLNPWNLERTPGGSSGGSAAALASGMVPLATGSDGGGSIRLPAAICGLSGIKTTQGRVPNGGPNPPGSAHFSVKGPMTVQIADAAFALDVAVGPHPTDPQSLPRSGAPWYEAVATARLPSSVVWSPTLGFAEVDAEIAAVTKAAVDRLADLGVEIIEIDDIWPTDPLEPWWNLWIALRARTQGHLIDTPEWDLIDPSLQFQVERGLKLSGVDVARSLDAVHEYNLQLDRAFEQSPLLLTPAAAGQTPFIGRQGTINGEETPSWVKFSYGFNLTRNPAGTVNCGFTADGMPVGLQVVARQLGDVSVIQTIASFEEVFASDARAAIG